MTKVIDASSMVVDAKKLIDWCIGQQYEFGSKWSSWHEAFQLTRDKIEELSVEVPDTAGMLEQLETWLTEKHLEHASSGTPTAFEQVLMKIDELHCMKTK